MERVRGDTIVSQPGLATSYYYDLALDKIDGLALQVTYTNATPVADTFVDNDVTTETDSITLTAHGFFSGLKVAATTSGVLPGGLSATDYFVIVVDANTVKLATSLDNAAAGTAVEITSAAGGGTHTLTPSALGSVVIKAQASNDGINFEDLSGITVTVSAAGTKIWNIVDPFYRYLRILHTPSAGAVNLTVVLNAKAER